MHASLVFHDPERPRREHSPFADAIAEVAASGRTLLVASPYISIDVLAGAIAGVAQFRLLTDAEEWLRTTRREERANVIAFCARYAAQIRHARGLHAKLVASDRLALIGSANLTASGIETNEEMGVMLRDRDLVAQVGAWHAALWDRSAILDTEQLQRLASLLPEAASVVPAPRLRLPGLAPLPKPRAVPKPSTPEVDETAAIARLEALCVSEAWASEYLDIVRLLYGDLKLADDDPRLALTLTKDGNAPLTINNRWVLDCLPVRHREPGDAPIRLTILASMTSRRAKTWMGGEMAYQFRPRSDDESDPPSAVYFDSVGVITDTKVRSAWLATCKEELAAGRRTSNRKFHSWPLLRAALDKAYRRELFAKVVFYSE